MSLFHPQIGYLNFWPNLATLLATIPPLEFAPLITTLMALLVQLIPISLILWSKAPFWNSWIRKLIGISIFIFVPLSYEVWLNTINSHNYFAIITFLILLEESQATQVRRWIYRTLLLIGGLTGTISCFLIPLFLFQVIKEKNKERLLQFCILLTCAMIQVYFIFGYTGKGEFSQRFNLVALATIGSTLWTQSIGLFIFGFTRMSDWARTLLALVTNNFQVFRIWGSSLLIIGILLFFLLSANIQLKTRILFISGYMILMVLTMMFSIEPDKISMVYPGNDQRIFFAPNVLLGWMLLYGICFHNRTLISRTNLVSSVCSLILILALFWGVKSYSPKEFIGDYWPDWKSEVQLWKSNTDYPLRILPYKWIIQLQPH
jgi:hypothetical protein